MLATLRQRNFAFLWLGGLISMTGDWVLFAALPFYVYQQTNSTLATAGLLAAELLPYLLFGSISGVFVDRWDRKRIMVVSNLVQTVVVLLLLLIQSNEWLWVVYVVSFIQTTVATFFGPAETALLPKLVSDEHLLAANSLNALNNNVARLIGPPIGGTLLALFGLYGVIIVDSISFLVAALLIVRITAPSKPVQEVADAVAAAKNKWTRFWEEWLDGLKVVRRERIILILFVVLIIANFGGVMFDPLYPPFVADILKAGPEGWGWMLTTQAIGGIIGGIIVARFGNALPAVDLVGWGSILAGLLLAIQFNIPLYALALGISFLVGIPSAANRVAFHTVFQRNVPDKYMGRVSGAFSTTMAVLSLVSVLGFAGTLGNVFGVIPMLNVAAGITVLAGALALVLLPRSTAQNRATEQAEAIDQEASA
jgi:MFS family permease